MPSTPLTVAAAQPVVTSGDLDATVRAHAELMAAARADLWVFPELSLTGYVLDAPAVPSDVLGPLVAACGAAGSTALVGAPVEESAGRFIAMLAVTGSGVEVAYRKQYVGADEARSFAAGPAPAVLDIAGWRVGLGICRDTGQAGHHEAVAALRPDLYVAGLVHADDELAEQDRRGALIASLLHAPVVFASFAGPTGEGYTRTAGRSTIWDATGSVLARADDRPGSFALATLHRGPRSRRATRS
ncbi:MAG: carbon-nitrogen hydrolase family protein [Jatrophihabitans sp.]|uniref:carbon-nitrogen hydrolase family protein n=1 Tax=Jatrophihabitans sp. TaxID=1932789 RepID=UPI003F7F0260